MRRLRPRSTLRRARRPPAMPPRPCAALCVSSTGLEPADVDAVRRAVEAAGGRYSAALRSDVTHLVADAAGSEKHRSVCAGRFLGAVAVVRRAWVEELRGCGDGELPPVEPHLLPPLTGLTVCATGFTDRAYVQGLLRKSGAVHAKSLSMACSHLVAAKPEGKKYDFAMRRPIKIVSIDWLRDCVERSALLPEADYVVGEPPPVPSQVAAPSSVPTPLPPLPPPDRSRSALPSAANSLAETVVQTEQQSTNEELAHITPSFALESCCVYIVPCMQDADPAIRRRRVRVMRLAALSSAMVSPRWSPAVTHAVLVSVPIVPAQVEELRQAQARGVIIVDRDWMQHSANCGAMMAESDYPPPTWTTGKMSQAFLDNSSGAAAQVVRENASTLGGRHSRGASNLAPPVFQGVRLALGPLAMQAPDLCAELSSVVLAGRGKVLTHDGTGRVLSGVPTHVLCPMGLSAGELAVVASMRENNVHVELVTRMWVEECVVEKRLISASSCVLFTAREFDLPLCDFRERKVVIAISGFMTKLPNPDRNLRRDVLGALANILGAEYSERMNRRTCTHLIVESSCTEISEKVKCAIMWNVPVVTEHWLLACAKEGALLPLDPYTWGCKRPSGKPLQRLPSGNDVLVVKTIPEENFLPPPAPVRRKRPADSKSHDRDRSTPRRKSSRVSPPDPAASAEALMKQLAVSLVKATDASTACAGGGKVNASGAVDNGSRGASIGDDRGDALLAHSVVRPCLAGKSLEEDALRNFGDHDAADLQLLRETGSGVPVRDELGRDVALPRRSEWSLEASQSQMIMHRDLTPPPTTLVEPKQIPRLRTMPSRAAKSRQ